MSKQQHLKVKARAIRNQLLFEQMFNGFFIAEPLSGADGGLRDIRLIDGNPGFEREIPFKKGEWIGKTWSEATHYSCPNLAVYQKVLTTGDPQVFELYNPLRVRYYHAKAFKIGANRIGVVFEDITPLREALQEINRLKRQLETRVTERTRDLQQVAEDLEAFSYTVAHDLKAPLRAIVGYTQFIWEDYGAELSDDVGQMVRKIATIGNNALGLIDHLLKYGMLTKRAICWEDLNIQELITEVFRKLQTLHPGRVMDLQFIDPLPPLRGDRILLTEVVYNVLDNAVKFTRDRVRTVITVGCRSNATEHQLYIRDNGVGFEMEYAGKLFGIFERLHTQEEFEGSGVGLALVWKLMRRHGGRAGIEGRLNEGATVYLVFPKGPPGANRQRDDN
ncbi:MAG: ATP-binding protein [Bacillota bacterium]|jgi:signal transduction histidine kinase